MPINSSDTFCQHSTEVNTLNLKALYDDTQSDVSINRKSLFRHADAWETLRLRNASFAASFDHAILAGMVLSGQVGTTAAQQTVSPIRTGAGDTEIQQPAGAVYPANRFSDNGAVTATNAVDAAIAQSVQGNVSAQIADLTTQVSTLAALMAQLVKNSGNAGNASSPATA